MKIQNIITFVLLALLVLFVILYFTKPKTIVVHDTQIEDSLKRELQLTTAARDSALAREKRKDDIFRKALAIQRQETKQAERSAAKAVQRVHDMQAAAPMPERDSVVNQALSRLQSHHDAYAKENLMLSQKLDEKSKAYDDLAEKSQSENRIAAALQAETEKERDIARTDYQRTARKLGFWKGLAVGGTVTGFVLGATLIK